MPVIKDLIAYGSSGTVTGQKFKSYKTRKGYPLQSIEKMRTTGKTLQSSSNTEHVPSLEEAVRLLKTGKYRIRLKCDSVKPAQYNMREWEAVEVVY